MYVKSMWIVSNKMQSIHFTITLNTKYPVAVAADSVPNTEQPFLRNVFFIVTYNYSYFYFIHCHIPVNLKELFCKRLILTILHMQLLLFTRSDLCSPTLIGKF